MPFNTAKGQRRRLSKLKAGTFPGLEDNSKTESEISADVGIGIADSSNGPEENIGMCESVAETPMTVRNAGSADDAAEVATLREPEQLNSRPSRTHVRSLSHERRLQGKLTPGQKRKLVATNLRKKNGIIVDVVETGTLSSSESVVGEDFGQINGEKPSHAGESTNLTTSLEKNPGKRCRASVVNGYHRSLSVTTRRRSSLQENNQTPSLSANKLETSVSGIVADTITALLEEISESKDLELVNGKELVVDGN